MDKIFGYENFQNEISWCYKEREISKRRWNVKHDSLLFYSKGNEFVFNWDKVTTKYSEGSLKKFTLIDEDGRRYQIRGRGGPYVGEQQLDPGIEKEHPEWTYRDYLDEKPGVLARDWWDDIPFVNRAAKERVGYPTQKPEALLERIIKASSNEGDVIADFFVGGGTTCAVAMKLNRRFIGCDSSRVAIAVTLDRLVKIGEEMSGVKSNISTGGVTVEEKFQTEGMVGKVPNIEVSYLGVYPLDKFEHLSQDDFVDFVLTCPFLTPRLRRLRAVVNPARA